MAITKYQPGASMAAAMAGTYTGQAQKGIREEAMIHQQKLQADRLAASMVQQQIGIEASIKAAEKTREFQEMMQGKQQEAMVERAQMGIDASTMQQAVGHKNSLARMDYGQQQDIQNELRKRQTKIDDYTNAIDSLDKKVQDGTLEEGSVGLQRAKFNLNKLYAPYVPEAASGLGGTRDLSATQELGYWKIIDEITKDTLEPGEWNMPGVGKSPRTEQEQQRLDRAYEVVGATTPQAQGEPQAYQPAPATQPQTLPPVVMTKEQEIKMLSTPPKTQEELYYNVGIIHRLYGRERGEEYLQKWETLDYLTGNKATTGSFIAPSESRTLAHERELEEWKRRNPGWRGLGSRISESVLR